MLGKMTYEIHVVTDWKSDKGSSYIFEAEIRLEESEIEEYALQNGIIENEIETDPVDEMDTIRESQTDNHILELLTNLSKMRPDIVDRVLKENIGPEASLAEIKLSDLHYVVELLKVSENVERD